MHVRMRYGIVFIIAVVIVMFLLIIINAIYQKAEYAEDKFDSTSFMLFKGVNFKNPQSSNPQTYLFADAHLLPQNNKQAAKRYLQSVYKDWNADMWS